MAREAKVNYKVIIITALALFNVIIHLVFSYNLEYHRDELLYFSLGQHPAFGYATVPPLIGWIAWIMQHIFGNSLFAVRFFPALLSGVMVFLIAALTKELGGSGYARILAAAGIILSIFGLRTFLLFQPVHIDLILWTLCLFLVVKYINTSSGKYLILLGIALGLALLNKYLIGVLVFSFLIIIPFTKHKSLFINRNFWYGILAGILVFLPNLIWQVANGFPVINHMKELKETQLVNVDQAAFLLEQLIIPAAASLLTVAGLIYLLVSKKAVKYRFIGLAIIGVIIIIMLFHGKNYYTQGIFPFLIAAGAVSWENVLRKTWMNVSMILLLIILTLPILPIGIPVYKTSRLVKYFRDIRTEYGMDFVCRFEDNSIHSLPQDYADMLGWEELTLIANEAWQMVPDKKAAFIYCENYGQAGAITVIGKKYGLPEAVCFSESFRYWFPAKFNPDISSMVYINDEPGEDVKQLFRKITRVGSISNPDARELGTSVYLCQDPVDSFNRFWTLRLKEL
jgi:hypothetical protein